MLYFYMSIFIEQGQILHSQSSINHRNDMNWKKTRADFLPRLEALTQALKHLRKVSMLENTVLTKNEKDSLAELTEGVQRQLNKLQKNEFHIAVVGLEKAGKSTFLNAWIKSEILPNEQKRCTYTSTEIRSLGQNETSYIEIEYLSQNEFQELQMSYEKLSHGRGLEAENARGDLAEIKQNMSTITALLGLEAKTIPFNDNSEVMELLKPNVADPARARAIKTVKVHTHDLVSKQGVVFHDVPGYDSPLQIHKNQAHEELRRADVVILLTNISAEVSLRDQQVKMLNAVGDQEDQSIAIKDKLFVFLNKADMCPTKSDFQKRMNEAENEIVHKYDVCESSKLIPGSAAAYLIENASFITNGSRDDLGSSDDLYNKLKKLETPHGDGIEYLQAQIDIYLDTTRAQILAKRCNSYIATGNELINQALNRLQSKFPTSLSDLEQQQASRARDELNNWFDDLWERFQRNLARYWNQTIRPSQSPDESGGNHEQFEGLLNRYTSLVERLAEKTLLNKDEVEQVFLEAKDVHSNPNRANQLSRDKLIKDNILPAMDSLTDGISDIFQEIASELQVWVCKEFFNLEGVDNLVFPSTFHDKNQAEQYRLTVRYGLNALLLRYARPAAKIFIGTPRGFADREKMFEKYEREITLLSLYYEGNPQKKNLKGYLKIGQWIDVEEIVDEAIDTINPLPQKPSLNGLLDGFGADFLPSKKQTGDNPIIQTMSRQNQASNFDGVLKELQEDSNAFIDYLKNSVFHAASFTEFINQELEQVKLHLGKDDTRRHFRQLIFAANDRKAPELTAHIQGVEQNLETQRRIIEAIARTKESQALLTRKD